MAFVLWLGSLILSLLLAPTGGVQLDHYNIGNPYALAQEGMQTEEYVRQLFQQEGPLTSPDVRIHNPQQRTLPGLHALLELRSTTRTRTRPATQQQRSVEDYAFSGFAPQLAPHEEEHGELSVVPAEVALLEVFESQQLKQTAAARTLFRSTARQQCFADEAGSCCDGKYCPYNNGVCCGSGKFCCPPHTFCLASPDGQQQSCGAFVTKPPPCCQVTCRAGCPADPCSGPSCGCCQHSQSGPVPPPSYCNCPPPCSGSPCPPRPACCQLGSASGKVTTVASSEGTNINIIQQNPVTEAEKQMLQQLSQQVTAATQEIALNAARVAQAEQAALEAALGKVTSAMQQQAWAALMGGRGAPPGEVTAAAATTPAKNASDATPVNTETVRIFVGDNTTTTTTPAPQADKDGAQPFPAVPLVTGRGGADQQQQQQGTARQQRQASGGVSMSSSFSGGGSGVTSISNGGGNGGIAVASSAQLPFTPGFAMAMGGQGPFPSQLQQQQRQQQQQQQQQKQQQQKQQGGKGGDANSEEEGPIDPLGKKYKLEGPEAEAALKQVEGDLPDGTYYDRELKGFRMVRDKRICDNGESPGSHNQCIPRPGDITDPRVYYGMLKKKEDKYMSRLKEVDQEIQAELLKEDADE